jgi:hypothetical protein
MNTKLASHNERWRSHVRRSPSSVVRTELGRSRRPNIAGPRSGSSIGYYVSNARPAGRCSTRLAHSLGLAHSLTAPEIADLLGLTLTTVKIRLHRARRKLQQIMERGCAVSDDNRGVHTCHPKS